MGEALTDAPQAEPACVVVDSTDRQVTQALRRLQERRRALGFTQLGLATLVHLSGSAMSKVERGESTLSLRLFLLLARMLHCAPDDLLPPPPFAALREVLAGAHRLTPERLAALRELVDLLPNIPLESLEAALRLLRPHACLPPSADNS